MDRRGFTLIEALISSVLLFLVLALAARATASVRSGLATIATTSERVEAARTARHLLDHVATSDGLPVAGPARNEVTVRFPIGWGVPCDAGWSWSGLRAPDATKDSLVVLDRAGRSHTRSLDDVGSLDCEPPEGFQARLLDFDPPVPGAVLVRVWETGVIRIDDAVRYARAGASRQPLTATLLQPARSGVSAIDGGLHAVVEADSLHSWSRRWRAR